MVRFQSLFLVGAVGAALIACTGRPMEFDVQTPDDVQGVDVQMDVGMDVRDARTDAPRDALDGDAPRPCDPSTCDQACVSAGCLAGVCIPSGCDCRGCNRPDGGADAMVFDVLVMSCTTNAECGSPGLFCNGVGCGTPGFCSPRTPPPGCEMSTSHCGCDGRRYANLCDRITAGVRRNTMDTACPPAGDGGSTDARTGD
jgi:hypothetical protein